MADFFFKSTDSEQERRTKLNMLIGAVADSQGTPGTSVTSLERTGGDGSPGTVDTYTFGMSDGSTFSFDIYNGSDGIDGIDGIDGNSIVSVALASGDGSPGTTDVYTITYTKSSPTTFNVYNGANGTGTGDMLAANNLVELTDKSISRNNLNVYSTEVVDYKTKQNADAIANLASAQGTFVDDGTDILLTIAEQNVPFNVSIPSSDSSIFNFDEINNQISFLKDGSYNFSTEMTFFFHTNAQRIITIRGRNVLDDSLIYERTLTLEENSGDYDSIYSNLLITPGTNGFPSAPFDLYFTASIDDDTSTIDIVSFNSMLVSMNVSSSGVSSVSSSASNVLLGKDSISLDNFINTKNFAAVTYTGNGSSQDIVTGISSVDFTASGNGSGFWHDRGTGDCVVKNDAGDVVDEGSCVCSVSKVHIKSRTENDNSVVSDGVRGVGVSISTNLTDSELVTNNWSVVSFNNGSVGVSGNYGTNSDTETYVLYQTLYTHVKWGLTNQNKRYIEAYNPVTRETMVIYEGSGSAGHEIPHSLGVEIDYVEFKCLTDARQWNVATLETSRLSSRTISVGSEDNDGTALVLNSNGAAGNYGMDNQTNGDTHTYILYGKAKSETWTIVEYVGTGAAGNYVEVGFKSARVTIKAVSATGNWQVVDNSRLPTASRRLHLDLADEEKTTSGNEINFKSIGFSADGIGDNSNALGVKYIALVEADTNTNGGGSYFDLPTDDSNLNITDGTFTYTDGIDGNGFVRSSEQVTASIDFAGVSDGFKWVGKKLDGSGYIFEDKKPSVGLYEKESADDNRLVFDIESGKYYTTIGGELVTNGTFDVDTSGWSAKYDATLSIVNGQLSVNANTTNYPYAEQLIAVKKGVRYKVVLKEAHGTLPRLKVYNTDVRLTIEDIETTGGEWELEAVGDGNLIVRLSMQGAGDDDTAYFDDISVYKLEPTIDQPLATPVSFLPNPVIVASETPMDIREDDELPTNVMESLDVQGKVAMESPIYEDKPIYTGYAGGTNITAVGVIFNWTTEVDTHNAYNNGLWTCPKDGWYRFNPRVWNCHGDTTSTKIISSMYINGAEEARFQSNGTDYQKYISIEPAILKELKKGDTMYIESVTASDTHYIYFGSGKSYTNIVIEYIGETK